jgi:hypothetical protein
LPVSKQIRHFKNNSDENADMTMAGVLTGMICASVAAALESRLNASQRAWPWRNI